MTRQMFKGKIHRATVTQAELYYEGSITIDKTLLEASDIIEFEKVQVVNVNNGARIETYVFEGERDSGIVCLNGAAARHFCVGDEVIIMTYAQMNEEEIKGFRPKSVLVDKDNKIKKIL